MMSADVGHYHIGTVSSLTGIDPHSIRAWERRHRAIEPQRSAGGTRIYDESCVERLRLLKGLVDRGDPIRKVAGLSDAELRERLSTCAEGQVHQTDASASPAVLDAVMVAPGIASQRAASATSLPGLRVVLECDAPERLVATPRQCDLLIVELDALGTEPIGALDACSAAVRPRLVVAVYTFAQRAVLARLARRGVKLLRGPMSLEQLRRSLEEFVATLDLAAASFSSRPLAARASADGHEVPERVFDDAQLARLNEIASSVDCECPNHLARIVQSLVAFEAYQRRCGSADVGDEELHESLAQGTGRARALVEQMLVDVCEADEIDV